MFTVTIAKNEAETRRQYKAMLKKGKYDSRLTNLSNHGNERKDEDEKMKFF